MKLPSEAYALLNAISGPESAGSYNVIYGGQKVDDLSDHPRIAVTIKSGPNAGEKSTAAGKYQFLKGTWDQYAKKLGLKDFSPESQDLAAWELAKDAYKAETGEDLLSALKSGDANTIANVGKTLAPIWTSLPGGIEQGTTSSRFVKAYQGADGTPTAVSAVNALAGGQQPPRQPETNALVQNAQYVPPPFSGQRPVFAPLVSNEPLRPAELPARAPSAPIEPIAPTAADDEELLKGWGLSEQSTQAAPTAPAGVEAPSADDALLKAWGLDKTDVAPAGQMAKTAAANAPAAPEKSSTLEDVIKSGASGVARGTMELIGLPGTIQNAFDNSLSRVTGDIASLWGGKGMAAPPPSPLSGAGLRDIASKASEGGTEYKPQTTPGKFAGTVGEFVPGAVLGPGNALTNAVKFGVVPGVASEAAGQLTEGTALEPWARVGAAVAAPFATEGLLRAGEVVGNKLASMTPSGAAANNLTEALSQSGRTVGDVAAEMAGNPRLSPMDVDPNLQQMAMNLATKGGAPRSILFDAAAGRAAGAKGTVNSAYDAAVGAVPDVKAYLDNLKTTTKTNAKKAFGDALTSAKPVDLSPVLKAIDDEIAPGVQGVVGKVSEIPQGPVEQALARVRAKLANGNEMLTDADRLHSIQSQLRIDADTLAKSSSGQDKLVASALRKIRGKIVDQIDTATGGKFKPAQKQFADDNAIQDAFDKGLEVFKGGTGSNALENRPEYWQAWVKDASAPELEAAKVGTRVAVDQAIGTVRNAALKGEAIADVEFNVARLEALLGKVETGKLVKILKDEQKIAQTNAKLFAGSQTAPRQAVNKLTEVKEVTPGISLMAPFVIGGGYQIGGLPGAAAGAALSLGRMGVQKALNARDVARNRLMAEALSGDVTRLQSAIKPAASANRLTAPLRSLQNPLIRSATQVPLGVTSRALTEQERRGSR